MMLMRVGSGVEPLGARGSVKIFRLWRGGNR
jgi:hypothetical protein